MKKLNLRQLSKLLLILFSVPMLSGCLNSTPEGRSPNDQEIYLNQNVDEFNDFAVFFLSQQEVTNLRSSEMGCQIINKWSKCEGDSSWKDKSDLYPVVVKAEKRSIEDVLKEEKISTEVYERIISFLARHAFSGIGKDASASYLDVGDSRSSLRYYQDSSVIFNEDHEHVFVKKTLDHWYIFQTDWN